MKKSYFALAAALAVAGSAQAAVLYTTDFETPQGANFTSAISSADTEFNYSFNYAAYVPTTPTTALTIPAAPSGSGTTGLMIRATFDGPATNEGATAYINAGAGKTNYVLKFDAYQMFNGAVALGVPQAPNTTVGMAMGNAAPSSAMHSGATAFTGWFIMITPEGGNGTTDVRYYSGTGAAPVNANTTPDWRINGGTVLPTGMPGTASEWPLVFPATDPNVLVPGCPGRQWVTWEVTSLGGNVSVKVTPVGGPTTTIASWAQANNNTPGVGFFDPNTGSVVDPLDSFVVIDNLTLTEPSEASEGWALYN
ncbi:hypothetical protein IT571_02365 [Candidatus Sumerlaeota bacterium]|nr:hypothetical protein [Candidatus Sumerlaeota bacterium]